MSIISSHILLFEVSQLRKMPLSHLYLSWHVNLFPACERQIKGPQTCPGPNPQIQ